MKAILALLLGFVLTSVGHTAESDWIKIAATGNLEFSMKKNTGVFAKNDGGERIYLGIGRVVNGVTTETRAEVWYVTMGTCAKQFGSLISTDSDGKVTSKSEFVFGQGSVASEIGEVLCYLARKTDAEKSSTDSPSVKSMKKTT